MPVYYKALGSYGDLGNSMFQAACTIALAKQNNDSYFFPSNCKYRHVFNLPQSCFIDNINAKFMYEEPHFHYAPIPYKNSINLVGYFQSYRYFIDFSEDIKQLFRTKYSNTENLSNITSIHVRRTDYLLYPNHHPVPSMGYFEKAMELVGTNKFIVFSDDISWCKDHFIGNQFDFSESNDPVYDLTLQSKCANNIISNSSFSWWAAWLNENPNKIIIAPQIWFGPALSTHNTKDLYFPGMTII